MSLMDYFAIHVVPKLYRGKGAFHPSETGRLTENVSCVREYDRNRFRVQKSSCSFAGV